MFIGTMDVYGCLADKNMIKWKLTDDWIVWVKVIVYCEIIKKPTMNLSLTTYKKFNNSGVMA